MFGFRTKNPSTAESEHSRTKKSVHLTIITGCPGVCMVCIISWTKIWTASFLKPIQQNTNVVRICKSVQIIGWSLTRGLLTLHSHKFEGVWVFPTYKKLIPQAIGNNQSSMVFKFGCIWIFHLLVCLISKPYLWVFWEPRQLQFISALYFAREQCLPSSIFCNCIIDNNLMSTLTASALTSTSCPQCFPL